MKTNYKLVVGGDFGHDNGIVNCGEFPTIEEAINASSLPENNPQCEWYGSYVADSDGKIVAEANGYWGDHNPNWHSFLPFESNERPCTCGSGIAWADCGEASSYCG